MTTADIIDPAAPHTYPSRILLMVTGRSPQIITETIYALCCKQEPAFIPTEVQIITTSEGAEDVRLSLLSEDPGWFRRLRNDWNLPEISFGLEQIHILTKTDGQSLSDIRTHADNDQAADYIIDKVRQLTADTQCALHVSLAGGRKTMGYFLGYALSLYGRPQDRLSHVLVNQPFESNRDFFYPTPNSRIIYTVHPAPTQQRPIDAKDGQVTLADIPFVRLRNLLDDSLNVLQTGHLSFSKVVAAAQKALEPPAVTVDYRLKSSCIRIHDGQEVKLSPANLAFYGWLARRRKLGKEPVEIARKSLESYSPRLYAVLAEHLQEYLAEEQHVDKRNNASVDRKLEEMEVMTYQYFHQRKTSIKDSLEQELGPLAVRYEIQQLVKGKPGKYGLDIAPKCIDFMYDTI